MSVRRQTTSSCYTIASILAVFTIVCLLTTLCAAGGVGWHVTQLPTPTPAPTPTTTPFPTPTDERIARHLRIFTELWEIVRDRYLYPDYNGVDWEAVGQEYRAYVETGLSDDEFWYAMDALLVELDDEHSIFLSPDGVAEEEQMRTGEMDYVGVGIYAAPVPDKEYSVVLLVFPDGPAAQAGLRPHDHILTVDDSPACCDEFGYDRLWALYGPEDSSVELRVQAPDGLIRTVTVTRRRIQGPLPIETRRLEGDIGYILIPSLWDETIVERVRQALKDLSAEGELRGLILDNRINPGGSEAVLVDLLALFTDGRVGQFESREKMVPVHIEGVDVEGSQRVPLVVLIGTETVSFAEIFSGVLGEVGRARLVGRTTPGNVEILYGYDFEDGSRAWIAQETFDPPSGTDWEKTGIVPHLEIPLDWDEFTAEDDPQLEAALRLLR
jgi:C-terminal peptidase prc